MQLLTGLTPEGAVQHIAWLGVNASVAAPVPEAELRANLQGLHEALRGLWREAVRAQVKRRRGRKQRRANLPQFQVGDLVLLAQAVKPNKLAMTWTGPHEVVTAVSNFVYKVRPCVADNGNRKPITAHVVRLRRFANAPLGTPADREAIQKAALHDYPDNVVKRLVTHRMTAAGMQLKVRWLGFDHAHDTWEPVENLAEDVPDLVETFLYKNRQDRRCARALTKFFPG